MTYNSQEGVSQEKEEVQRHQEEDREFSLHQLAKEPELEQESLPYQEEEPENEAEMHDYLNSIM